MYVPESSACNDAATIRPKQLYSENRNRSVIEETNSEETRNKEKVSVKKKKKKNCGYTMELD